MAAKAGDAREATRDLVQSWIGEKIGWNGIGWRSDVLATRVFAWIAHFDEIVRRDQDDPLRRAMLTSLVAQLRHLARTASWEAAGATAKVTCDRRKRLPGLAAPHHWLSMRSRCPAAPPLDRARGRP